MKRHRDRSTHQIARGHLLVLERVHTLEIINELTRLAVRRHSAVVKRPIWRVEQSSRPTAAASERQNAELKHSGYLLPLNRCMRSKREEAYLALLDIVVGVARVLLTRLQTLGDAFLQSIWNGAASWCAHDVQKCRQVTIQEAVRACEENNIVAAMLENLIPFAPSIVKVATHSLGAEYRRCLWIHSLITR